MNQYRICRFYVLYICLLLLVTPALAQDNQTPTHRRAVVFAPHPSGQKVDEFFVEIMRAEDYPTAVHVFGRGQQNAGLDGLRAIAASDWGVLYIHTHGAPVGIMIEDFGARNEENVLAANRALAEYQANTDIPQAVRDDLGVFSVEEQAPFVHTRVGIGIDHDGLRELFGNAGGDRRVVILTGCDGVALQNQVPYSPTFAATEFLAFDGPSSNEQLAIAVSQLANLGGYQQGYPRRPIPEAIQDTALTHIGSGDTTLAAAITAQVPAHDAVLPLGVATTGSTTYDTQMNTTQVEIVSVTGCSATVTNQTWASNTSHTFKVMPTAIGRMTLTIDPERARDAGNGNRLVGNKWGLDEETGERTLAEEYPFGLSGLDGGEVTPTPNPYRWCVWCGAAPTDSDTTDDEQSMMPGSEERSFTAGQRHAFIIYQDNPQSGTRFAVNGAPPTLTLEQTGEWYALVTFTPGVEDVGQRYDLTFNTVDEWGPRASRSITYVVVAPSEPWEPPTDTLAGAPPTIEGETTLTMRVGDPMSLGLYGFDPDGDPLTWTVERAPVDVELVRDDNSVTLEWVPSTEDVGEKVIALALTDSVFTVGHVVTVQVLSSNSEAPAIEVILDDFEAYDSDIGAGTAIFQTWIDGWGYGSPDNPPYSPGNGTGAVVGDENTESFCEETIVNGGSKSLPLWYYNNTLFFEKYSETQRDLTDLRDWTAHGVGVLSLWFRGVPENDPEPLYVAISNENGPPAVVVHPDPNAAQIDTWARFIIPLERFSDQGVVLTDVDSIALGLGNRLNPTPGGEGKMYFDDIRLYRLPYAADQIEEGFIDNFGYFLLLDNRITDASVLPQTNETTIQANVAGEEVDFMTIVDDAEVGSGSSVESGSLRYRQDTSCTGKLIITYDNIDGSAKLVQTTLGLGGIDITCDGKWIGIEVEILDNAAPIDMSVILFSGQENYSELTKTVPSTESPITIKYPFSEFLDWGNAADKTAIQAIMIVIGSAEGTTGPVNIGIDSIMMTGEPSEPEPVPGNEEIAEYQVSASEDDGYASNENLQNLSSDFLRAGLSVFAGPPYYLSGMVFRNVNIPQGAEIVGARLKVRSHNNRLTDTVYFRIEAEAADDAAAFGSSRHIGSLLPTSTSVDWILEEAWSADTWCESPDITDVIREVIDRPGWSAGNSLAILCSATSQGGYRNISSFDRGSDSAPILEITYIPR